VISAALAPCIVLEHGHYPTSHQARCRLCHWRSQWRSSAVEARAEHAEHLVAAHAEALVR
jgi:hypothetical protein